MKKYILLLLTLTLLVAMCACSGNGENSTAGSTTVPSGSTTLPSGSTGTTTLPTGSSSATEPSATVPSVTDPPATGSEGHVHSWSAATCESARVCSKCGEVDGAPLGHAWQAVSCAAPKHCATCGKTEGEALPHTWVDATCTTAKTCSVCHATEGSVPGHQWVAATCESARTCSVCGLSDGEIKGHSWAEATTEAPKTCTACGRTEGERIITDPRFHTADCKPFFGTWVGALTELECRISFGEAGELTVIRKHSEYESEITTGVYYVSGNTVYMGTSWDSQMVTSTAELLGGKIRLTGSNDNVTLEPIGSMDADWLDPRFDLNTCKSVIGTWGVETVYFGRNVSATCVFTKDGYVYAYITVDSTKLCRIARYYVEGNKAYGGFCWEQDMRSMEFELADGKLKAVIEGIQIQLEKRSDSAANFIPTSDGRFLTDLCSPLFGTWTGTQNGKKVTYRFGEDGNLLITTQLKDGVVKETKKVYFVGGTSLYLKWNWLDNQEEQSGKFTLQGDKLQFTVGGTTVTLTKEA